MKTFTPGFEAEKSKKTGASPVWILECPFATGTLHISDYVFTVPGWAGSDITARSWVRSWGRVTEDISGEMSVTRASSFTLDVLVDPGATPAMDAILDDPANHVESTDCFLYLWFLGLDAATDPPELMWRGNITDWERIDELTMRLDLNDVSVRLDRYVGTKLTLDEFPAASPDDVGKVLPIVYGAGNMVRALKSVWGARTTLREAISASRTVCRLSLAALSEMPQSGYMWIDNELVQYASITKTSFACDTIYEAAISARGASGTIATAHGAGAPVAQYVSSYQSIVAAHALSAVHGVYAVIAGVPMAVSDGITVSVDGNSRHVISSSRNITVSPLSYLSLSDPSHTHGNVATGALNGSSASSADLYGTFTWTGTNDAMRDGSAATYRKATCTGTSQATATFTVGFPTYYGPSPTAVYAVITHYSFLGSGAPADAWIRMGSTDLSRGSTVTQKLYIGTSVPASVTVTANHPTSAASYEATLTIYEIALEINTNTTSTSATGISVTGGVIDARYVDHYEALVDGYADDGSGAVTGTPGALIERPDHVAGHFLHTHTSWPFADFLSNGAAAFGSVYKFSIVIDRYERLKTWLARMAWESRSYFRFAPSRAEFIVRPDTLAGARTLTAHMTAMDGDHRTLTRVRRSRLEDVINRIQVSYGRDATKSGQEAYRGITPVAADASSIARYGLRESPALFTLDFVQSPAMAESLRDFYLARCKDRKRLVETTVFLDNGDLEFADGVALQELGDLLCEVQQVNIIPGGGRDMTNDGIQLIAREY